jgi:hypothetical protein
VDTGCTFQHAADYAHYVVNLRGALLVFPKCLYVVINRERARVYTSQLLYYRGSFKFLKGVAEQMLNIALGWMEFPCLLWSDRAIITLPTECIKCRNLNV